VKQLDAKYGLNQPLPEQFATYLWHVLHFDFGSSYVYQGESVTSLILQAWPYTAILGLVAFFVVVVVGVSLGIVAAVRQGGVIDSAILATATVGAGIPSFVLGIVLVVVFAVDMNRWTGGSFALPSGGYGFDSHLILPVITLAAFPTVYIARLTRASAIEVLHQEYVTVAWAKGMRERSVVLRHVLKNSLLPVVSALGVVFALLLTGSVVVETVFSIPGIGQTFIKGVEARDYPVILAMTVLYGVVIAVANLVVDVVYTVVDPRVRR
jgi:oligopeptide transport system permease protein